MALTAPIPLALSGQLLSSVRATEETGTQLSLFGWLFYPVLFIALAMALACLFTIHRQDHLTEVQKLKWLLFSLFLPLVGPIAYWLRLRSERKESQKGTSNQPR